ncbi:hypothetical protein CR513_18684, partial [Mucuna pruriens]
MIARTKIDVHVRTLSMEFGDTLVQFNIFEAMKHPMEDTSLFGIDLIDELVEEHMQANTSSTKFFQFARNIDIRDCLGSEVHDTKVTTILAHLDHDSKSIDLFDQVHKNEKPGCSKHAEVQVPDSNQVDQIVSRPTGDVSPPKPPIKLKPLPDHLKYAYLGINPSICMHRILMEEEVRSVRQQQKRLNPTILDVVKKEVTKLLAAKIIYPISNSN